MDSDDESRDEPLELPVEWLDENFRPTDRAKAVWGDRLTFKDGDMVMETLAVKDGKIIENKDDDEEYDEY